MKALRVVLPLLLVLAACGEQVEAKVNCEVTTEGTVKCDAQQTKGKTAMEVCWDFGVTCDNGATLKAERTCTTVEDGGSNSVIIPTDKIKIEGSCEGEMKAELANMEWKAK